MTKLTVDDDWFQASYNHCINWLSVNNRLEALRKSNWVPQEEFYPLKETIIGLAELYPKRILSPILHRLDSDDMLCATKIDDKDNTCPVIMIHDFASEGWEFCGQWNTITDWYEDKKAWDW